MWQDWAINLVQWVFVVNLFFVILDKTKKPPLLPSVVTSAGIFVIAAAMATLELWGSAMSAVIMAIEWGIIAYQRYRLDRIR